jgi:hypothetical protein
VCENRERGGGRRRDTQIETATHTATHRVIVLEHVLDHVVRLMHGIPLAVGVGMLDLHRQLHRTGTGIGHTLEILLERLRGCETERVRERDRERHKATHRERRDKERQRESNC